MPTVTIDARGLLLGGKRRWLTSGTIDPARTPAELWPQRLAAAREAGLTGVLVPAVWAAHEPRAGSFDFAGDRDLAAFIRLAGQQGLLVALRPGPFQGAGWDRGGIPAWVDPGADPEGRPLALRSAAPEFLRAVSAWFRALAGELKGLQATEGGPIVLFQNEHRWFCNDPDQAAAYLGELARFRREAGFVVPAVSTNNLFAAAEGEIEAWNGQPDLLATLRQLRAVRPDQPAFLWDYELARPSAWGSPAEPVAPDRALHDLAQSLAAGAQLNLGPFAGGSRFGFTAGRLPFARDGFVTQSADDGAPLDEAGRATPLLDAIRPFLLFTSSFERTLSMIDWNAPPAALAPQPGATTVVQATGPEGSVVVVLRDPDAKPKRRLERELLLPSGRRLTVNLTDRPAVWCVLDAPLGARRTLDYASASVFWASDHALALTAPPGTTVSLSINGSEIAVSPSKGLTPTIVEHEGVTVAALSTEQAAAAVRTPDGLLIGAEGAGRARDGWKKWTLLKPTGAIERGEWDAPSGRGPRRTLGAWRVATTAPFVTGDSERYAVIDGPATLDALGAEAGYGWYRWRLKPTVARRVKAMAPESGDRLHFYANAAPAGVTGIAPGAADGPIALPISKETPTLVALVENLGRPSGGWSESHPHGVWGPVYEVKPLKVARPSLEPGEQLAPLDFRTPLTRLHAGELTRPSRVTWAFTHRRKSPILLRLRGLREGLAGLLVVNDAVVGVFDEGSRGDVVLRHEDTLRVGKNTVQFATLGDPAEARDALTKSTEFYEAAEDLTAGAEWSFARWEPPADRAFTDWDGADDAGLPAWWRATFPAQPGAPALAFDPKGLTKGQLYLNGHNLGRYFVATARREAVKGQRGVYLPGPWLRTDAPNEITVFDEHGASPASARVVEFGKRRG